MPSYTKTCVHHLAIHPILLVKHMIEHEQVLRTDLNNSEIRYTKICIFLMGVYTHPTHLVCLRHYLGNSGIFRNLRRKRGGKIVHF